MSIILMEGFNHQHELTPWFYAINSNTQAVIQTDIARTEGALQLTGSNYVDLGVPVEPFEIIYFGFAFYITGISSFVKSCVSVINSKNAEIASIRMTSSGQIALYGARFTKIGISDEIISINTWYYVEAKITSTKTVTTDDCIITLDGVEIINPSSGDTKYVSSTTLLQRIVLSNPSAGAAGSYFDDVYIDDAEFRGAIKIATLYPNGNGTNDFVGSDGNSNNNYALVNQHPLTTSEYLDGKSNDVELFPVDACPDNIDIIALSLIVTCNKVNRGSTILAKLLAKVGSTNYSSDIMANTEELLALSNIWINNPATGSAWIKSDVDAAQFGIEVV